MAETLIQDLLDDDHSINDQRITVNRIYQASFTRPQGHSQARLTSPKRAIRSLSDVYKRIRLAIENYESRANTPQKDRIVFTEDKTDREHNSVIVAVSCQGRDPGAFSQGSPTKTGGVKEVVPHLREERNDPDYQGYKVAFVGQWFDNVVRLTVWARTNKEANRRVDWLEDLMEEYKWYFGLEGISRCIFIGRKPDVLEDEDGIRWYGRPLDYFVRTEKISMRSEKKIEEIALSITLADE